MSGRIESASTWLVSYDTKAQATQFPTAVVNLPLSLPLIRSQLSTLPSMASASSLPDAKIARRLSQVKHIILVLSGKGGVGKSSVSTQLALSLCSTHGASRTASRVGLLDIDLTGPSIPRMLGLDGQSVRQSSDGWVPVYADREQRLAVMSTGFLLKGRNESVVWRGPKKNAMIKQFLGDVRWGELDYLIVDTPPGE